MTGRLEGKSALITGSARGIGRAFAEAYIREGATVAIADIDFERASKTAREIGENAYAVELDVTKQHSIDTAIRTVEGQAGGLDILINNAALFDLAPIVEIKRESYERLFSINVSGTLFMMQAAAKTMIARGKGGKIINMASQAGRRGEAVVGGIRRRLRLVGRSGRVAAGAHAPRSAAHQKEIAQRGGGFGAPWEGVVALFAKYENRPAGETTRLVGEAVPFGRMGRAEDLTGMAIFLASDEAQYIVAQTYNVDGGNWMS